MNRREFLTAAVAGLLVAPRGLASTGGPAVGPLLPRWRGFNLLEKFYRNERFRERDFQWISDWGFNFVRLPLDYSQWTGRNDPYWMFEEVLAHVDEAVEFGRRYGLHVCLNLHNAPGYSVNAAVQHRLRLWHDEEAQL